MTRIPAMSDRVRAALVRSDSLLSLLRHRLERTIPWGSPGLPTLAHVDEVIGQARAALAAVTPGEPVGDASRKLWEACDAFHAAAERPAPTPETVERVARAILQSRRNTGATTRTHVNGHDVAAARAAIRAMGEGA